VLGDAQSLLGDAGQSECVRSPGHQRACPAAACGAQQRDVASAAHRLAACALAGPTACPSASHRLLGGAQVVRGKVVEGEEDEDDDDEPADHPAATSSGATVEAPAGGVGSGLSKSWSGAWAAAGGASYNAVQRSKALLASAASLPSLLAVRGSAQADGESKPAEAALSSSTSSGTWAAELKFLADDFKQFQVRLRAEAVCVYRRASHCARVLVRAEAVCVYRRASHCACIRFATVSSL
jgi:hypothetical protein